MAEDSVPAVQLQERWDAEDEVMAAAAVGPVALLAPSALRPLPVVDEAWELPDPSPNMRSLRIASFELSDCKRSDNL